MRREKIGERMKYLQDLVPGCNKITSRAGMLDEIINYVQSLQRQVEVKKNKKQKRIHLPFLSKPNSSSTPLFSYMLLTWSFFLPQIKQFLSMKLAAVNPRLDFNIEDLFAKEVKGKTFN